MSAEKVLSRLRERLGPALKKVRPALEKIRPAFQDMGPRLKRLAPALSARAQSAADVLRKNFPRNMEDLRTGIRKLQSDEVLDRLRKLGSGKAYGTYLRMGAAAFAAYFLADTVSLFTDTLVPDPPVVPPPPVAKKQEKQRSVDDYAVILARNIFNSKGIIPDEGGIANGPARKTALPLNLIGTVVLKNELKSIATIEDKTQNLTFAVRIDDTVDEKIRITRIEHLKVYFINKSTGNLEYVEIVEENGLGTQAAASAPAKKAAGATTGGVTQSDETHFDVERTAVDRAVGNLSEVLQQARAIPNFENGMPDGYKILQIVPGSIYDQLGIKNGDVITGLNGDPINDPAKAFQMFNELKTSNHLEIAVKRFGRKMVMNYDIR